MNKVVRELLASIQNKKEEARALANEGKVAEAKAMIVEINDLQDQFQIESALAEDEKGEVKVTNQIKNNTKASIEVQAFIRMLAKKPLTDEMKNALTTSTDSEGGVLVPSELLAGIVEVKRQYLSLKDVVGVIPVTSASGTVSYEDAAANATLVDFDEVSDLASQQPAFKALSFALKNKGAITPVSNVLLADETQGLPSYLFKNFARKAVLTENADIIAALKAGKTVKDLADMDALSKEVNKGLDPALLIGGAIITNQDGYHHLDTYKGADGRGILNQDIANPNVKTFKGMPIVVVSNAALPTSGTTTKKAPIFVGNFNEAVKFFDREVYEVAVSDQAGFTKYQTLMRVVERYDVKIGDVDAYINGTLDVTASI